MVAPYYRPHVGGVEAYSEELAAELDDAGADVRILTTMLPAGAPVTERAGGVAVRRLPAVDAIPNFPVPAVWRRETLRGVRSAAATRPDAVISHTRFFTTSVVAGVIAKTQRARWLHIEHGSTFVQLDSPVASLVARTYDLSIGRAVLRGADEVVGVSDAAGEFVGELAGRHATVMRRGVRLARIDAIAPHPEIVERAGDLPVVVYVGRTAAWAEPHRPGRRLRLADRRGQRDPA